MSDYYKITWGSTCSSDDIYYGDGYADHLFFTANDNHLFSPSYNFERQEGQTVEGRLHSKTKISKKIYSLVFMASETVADTINTIPLADYIYIEFPEGAIASITGDDVSLNIEPFFNKTIGTTDFKVTILFETNIILKRGCCVELALPTECDGVVPTISNIAVTELSAMITGTATTNLFVRSVYKKFLNQITFPQVSGAVVKASMYGAISGYWISSNGNIYKTTNAFATNTLVYTPNNAATDISCAMDGLHVIITVDDGSIVKTINGGTNWTVVPVFFAGEYFKAVKIASYDATYYNNAVFVGTDGVIYTTGDFCTNFTPQTYANSVQYIWCDLDYVLASSGVSDRWIIVGKNTVTNRGQCVVMEIGHGAYILDYTPTPVVLFLNTFPLTVLFLHKTGTVIAHAPVGTGEHGYLFETTSASATFGTDVVDVHGLYIARTQYGMLCQWSTEGYNLRNGTTSPVYTQIQTALVNSIFSIACFDETSPFFVFAQSTDIFSDYVAFTTGGTGTAEELTNGFLELTLPEENTTYITKVQTYLTNSECSESAEEIIDSGNVP